MVNSVILIGRLGGDPEHKQLQNSTVCNLNLATSEQWKDKDGQKQERTEWHRVVLFGKLADTCSTYLSKGSLAYIEGKLQTRKWEDKNGVTRYTTEVIGQKVQFLDSKSSQSGEFPSFDESEGMPF